MAKHILPIVKSQLPEFIRSEHPQFQLFVDAYYEYLEKQSDSDSTSALNLFKSVPNAGDLINNAEQYRDVHTTLDEFKEYFDSLPNSDSAAWNSAEANLQIQLKKQHRNRRRHLRRRPCRRPRRRRYRPWCSAGLLPTRGGGARVLRLRCGTRLICGGGGARVLRLRRHAGVLRRSALLLQG